MFKKFVIILLCFLCVGCNSEKKKVSFKDEYEKYNGDYIEVSLENTDIIENSDVSSINKIIESGTGVILIANKKDNLSRRAVSVLMEASSNTDLDKIYYIDSIEGIVGIDEIENKNIPLVLFVLDGKIEAYHVGTIEDKVELSEDETIDLYNSYLDGIHKVLQDACDESC